jgi:class 3 adenylate cyclase/tetratricopeptide (TPR) repeat protein
MRCPVCNVDNPDAAKFCSNCGNRMPERRTTGTSERRVVTVLFCDVKGSTTLAEKMDPEEWTEIIDGAFRVLTPPIQRYGGTVARLLGDAVLAFFGAPVAHEDDPERALRAGLDMLHVVAPYREKLVRERGTDCAAFDIRIGINTGVAVIGDVGSGQAVEYTGMGDAVNVAARLQSLAEPGTMLVSEHTLKRVPPVFEWEPLGPLDLKGREGKLEAFRVVGLSAAGTRTRPRGPITALIGRKGELAALRHALAETSKGSGRVVSIVGDAGLGKTRLIDELRAEREASGTAGGRWSEARGQSYEQTRSYGLFRQHLLSLAGASEADAPDVIRERVSALVPAERRTDERALRTLEVFLAVEAGGPTQGPEGEELRAEIHRLMHDVIVSLADRSVLVFDDLQWSDPASAELLMELFEIAEEAPVLFICAFRPDRQAPSWKIKQKLETDYPHRYDEVVLPPLSIDESAEWLGLALPGGGLPPQLRERILAKAEGNPFFLEEIVRALLDDGTIARDERGWRVTRADAEIRLPESLQAVLAARIDRLEAESRETLQAAAVIGRTFLYRILATIREASDKLDSQLRALQRLELVQERAREPEREYAFRHALTQEAAYGSILQRRRRELHLRVGEALESLFPDRIDELASILGHHYAEAGDERAVRYLKAAGDRALRLHTLDEAASHYRRAFALLRRADADAATVQEIHLRYGRTLELRGEYGAALPVYEELGRLARERGDAAMEGEALSAQTTIYSNPTEFVDPVKADALVARQIDLARQRGDDRLLARLLWNRGQVGFWRGDDDVGLPFGIESAEIARRVRDDEQLAYTLNSLGQMYRELNRLGDAEGALRESIALFQKVGNRPMEADSRSTLAFIHLYRGELDAALGSGMEAYRIGREIDNEWAQAYGLFTPGYVHFERGELGTALDTWDELVMHAEKGGFLAGQAGPGSDRGYLYAYAGDDETAIHVLEHTLDLTRKQFGDWHGWARADLARVVIGGGDLRRAHELLDDESVARHSRALYIDITIALARGELALAEGRAADALAIARGQRHHATDRGLRPFEKDFDLLEADALRAMGDPDAARVYERGIAESRALGSVRLLWQLHGGIAAVADARGDVAAARRARDEAAGVVDQIGASLAARGLEARFRARPRVREALGQATAARS